MKEIKMHQVKLTRKMTPQSMFERMVKREIEDQTNSNIYELGLELDEEVNLWYFEASGITAGMKYTRYSGYIGTLGQVEVTHEDGQRKLTA